MNAAFGSFVAPNSEGNFREQDRVYWKIPAYQVAFHWPYAVLFSNDQIEVRHICTGALIQMVKDVGSNLRCIWKKPPLTDSISGILCVSDQQDGTCMFEIRRL
ncbi:hypothetical protein C8J56DRAFT_94479 [Mycena floridula]|nr:hypothetical protein C8J56DRAFT_94479 [Mycena floridula]